MTTLLQELRFGIRLLAKSPGFTALAVLTLALGVTATTTIVSWMSATMLDPVPGVSDTGDMVSVLRGEYSASPMPPFSYPDFLDLRRDPGGLSEMLAYHDDTVFYTGGRAADRGYAAVVTANYFDFLGVRPVLGRGFTPSEESTIGGAPVAVISTHLWQRRFGRHPRVVGRTIEVNRTTYTIVGVAPAGFIGCKTGVRVDVWIPLSMDRAVFGGNRLPRRDTAWLNVVARLRPGVDRRAAEADLDARMRAIVARFPDAHQGPNTIRLDPLWRSPFGANGYLAASLPILLAIGGVVLLLACANVANLLLVRGVARRREMAIRVSMGAGRGRLVRQALAESLLIGLLGGVLAAVVTSWTAESLATFIPPSDIPIVLNGRLDGRVLLVTMTVSIVMSALCGVLPALRASSQSPVAVLKEEAGSTSGGRHKGRLLNGLVVAQVALSAVLLVCAGLFVRSLRNAEQAHPGFDSRNVVLASVNLQAAGYPRDRSHALQLRLLQKAAALPGVTDVTLADWVPLTFSRQTNVIDPEGYVPRPHESLEIRTAFVGPRYFDTLRIALLAGRELDERDRDGAARVCLVNREFAARYWPGEPAVGKRLQLRTNPSAPPDWRTVVGVAQQTRHQRLHESDEPLVYVPLLQSERGDLVLHVRTAGDPRGLLPVVEKAIRAEDPAVPVYNVTTLERRVRLGSLFERLGGTFVGTFGIVALALAAVGMYGVLAYSTRQRTREMGIRMALGAGQREVRWLVLRHGATLAGAGLAIGLLAAVGATRFVRSLLYGVAETDVLTFAAVAVLLASVAFVASAVPAWRAARVQPLQALRHE